MMVKRTMDEMITHFNDTVSTMDISINDKMILLGMITAIGYECQKAADAMELQKPKWIPVTERLPEQNTRVIGFMAWKGITAIEYQHGKWYSIDHLQPLPNEAVTHWMPLPEAPKGETDG